MALMQLSHTSANDGYKLGYKLSACAMDPPSILASRSGGFARSAWHHGGPTAPFIHVVTAFCFVLPKIFMEARLVDVGFLSQGKIRRALKSLCFAAYPARYGNVL